MPCSEQHRDLDHQWLTRNRNGQRLLLMLMPLTDAEGARGFVQRLEGWAKQKYSQPLAALGVRIQQVALDGVGRAEDKLRLLKEACELHAA